MHKAFKGGGKGHGREVLSFSIFILVFLYWCGVRHSSERGAGTVRRLRGRGIVVMNSVTFWKGNCKVKKA